MFYLRRSPDSRLCCRDLHARLALHPSARRLGVESTLA
jgi:hypothetical protein